MNKRTNAGCKQAHDGSDDTALLLQLRQHVAEVVAVVSFGGICVLFIVVAVIVSVRVRGHLVGCGGGCHVPTTTTTTAASMIYR